jgi:hypothetical protein
MLILRDLGHKVKSPQMALVPNPNHPAGANLCYKQLKAYGWKCHDPADRDGMEIHPTERVPVFRLGGASIRRNKRHGGWIVEVAGGVFEQAGDLAAITAEAVRLDAEAQAARLTPAAAVAMDLVTEYPALQSRIAAGLALVEAGKFDPAKYGTTWDNAGFYGCYSCDCPDSVNRKPRAKFGAACKHSFAMEISRRVKAEKTAMAYRRLNDKLDGDRARRAREQALPADVGTGRSILDMLDYDDPVRYGR